MQFIYGWKINGNLFHVLGDFSEFGTQMIALPVSCQNYEMDTSTVTQPPWQFSHIICHFHPCHLEKNAAFLHLYAAKERVCELRYRTGTDLMSVITSLSVQGEISCNIILKYTLGIWEKLSECQNLGLHRPNLTTPPSFLCRSSCHDRLTFTVCELRRQLIKIAGLRKNVNERSRLSLSVCPRASPSLSAGSLLFQTREIPLILQVVISSLLIDAACQSHDNMLS